MHWSTAARASHMIFMSSRNILTRVSVLSPIGPRSSRARVSLLPNVAASSLEHDLVADGSGQVLDFSEAPLPALPVLPSSPLIYGFPDLAVASHAGNLSLAAAGSHVAAPLTAVGGSNSIDRAPSPSSLDLSALQPRIGRPVLILSLYFPDLSHGLHCALP